MLGFGAFQGETIVSNSGSVSGGDDAYVSICAGAFFVGTGQAGGWEVGRQVVCPRVGLCASMGCFFPRERDRRARFFRWSGGKNDAE